MSRFHLRALAAIAVLAFVTGCDRDPDVTQRSAPEEPASRHTGDRVAPETHAIVAREGDQLHVIVDIAPRDAAGRKVEHASARVGGTGDPVAATGPTTRTSRLTIELRAPAGTREVTITGTSEGDVPWSTTVSTKLDG